MIPVDFEESNKVLNKPVGWTDEECQSLHVYTDGVRCISKWKLDFWERLEVLFRGSVWLHVWGTTPPVSLDVFYPFVLPEVKNIPEPPPMKPPKEEIENNE